MKPWRCTYHTGASPVGRFLHSLAFLVSSSLAVYWLTIFDKDGKSLARGSGTKLGSHLPVLVQGNWYLVALIPLVWGKVWLPEDTLPFTYDVISER